MNVKGKQALNSLSDFLFFLQFLIEVCPEPQKELRLFALLEIEHYRCLTIAFGNLSLMGPTLMILCGSGFTESAFSLFRKSEKADYS